MVENQVVAFDEKFLHGLDPLVLLGFLNVEIFHVIRIP